MLLNLLKSSLKISGHRRILKALDNKHIKSFCCCNFEHGLLPSAQFSPGLAAC